MRCSPMTKYKNCKIICTPSKKTKTCIVHSHQHRNQHCAAAAWMCGIYDCEKKEDGGLLIGEKKSTYGEKKKSSTPRMCIGFKDSLLVPLPL